jgi:hypothetical protein
LQGALACIGAVARNPRSPARSSTCGGDYLLAVKANRPSLRLEVERFFADGEILGLA